MRMSVTHEQKKKYILNSAIQDAEALNKHLTEQEKINLTQDLNSCNAAEINQTYSILKESATN